MVSKLTTFGNKQSHTVNCSQIFVLDMGTHGYTCEYPQWPGSCIYSQVPTDPQVFDSRLWVICGKKSSRIWVWHLVPKIPMGMDPGHPWVHSCSALSVRLSQPCTRHSGEFRPSPQLDPRTGCEFFKQSPVRGLVSSLVYRSFCWVVICPENPETFFFETILPPLSHRVVSTLRNVAYD